MEKPATWQEKPPARSRGRREGKGLGKAENDRFRGPSAFESSFPNRKLLGRRSNSSPGIAIAKHFFPGVAGIVRFPARRDVPARCGLGVVQGLESAVRVGFSDVASGWKEARQSRVRGGVDSQPSLPTGVEVRLEPWGVRRPATAVVLALAGASAAVGLRRPDWLRGND